MVALLHELHLSHERLDLLWCEVCLVRHFDCDVESLQLCSVNRAELPFTNEVCLVVIGDIVRWDLY